MAIGETLAEARREAGLSLADVSQRTRIRQTIIGAIEDDDYGACGGDFYARGHIRSIARAVGADSEPLIQEYDQHYRAKGAYATVSLDELLSASADGRPHGPDLSAVWGVGASAAAAVRRTASSPSLRRTATQARDRARRPNWAVLAGLALALVFGLAVYLFVTRSAVAAPPAAAGQHAAAHRAAPARHAAAHQPRTGGPSSAARASQRAAAASPAPAAASQPLVPVSAAAFGPGGGDNPRRAHLVLGGDGRAWRSDWYGSARFGNLYAGTGLLLDMGHPVTITAARVVLGRAAGASFQIRVGATPTLAGTRVAARAAGVGRVVRLRLDSPAQGRYVIVWFTRLPPDQSGTFQAVVFHISLLGHT